MLITLYAVSKSGRLQYYTLHDRQPSLGCRYTLTTSWRLENTKERERRYTFDSAQAMDKKTHELFLKKIHHGYTLLYCFGRRGRGGFGIHASLSQELESLTAQAELRAQA